MPETVLHVNGRRQTADVDADTPLLWVLRDTLGLVGTKFGCGGGFCGACTVHVDGVATRACTLPLGKVGGPRRGHHRRACASRCSGPGPSSTWRSAATARPASS